MIEFAREGGKAAIFQGSVFDILNWSASPIMSDQQSKAQIQLNAKLALLMLYLPMHRSIGVNSYTQRK